MDTAFFAKDANGDSCNSTDKNAVCWCPLGAIFAAYPDREQILVIGKLQKHLDSGIMQWNDTPGRTKEEVIAALEAIGE
jgi:hypothetical protein